MRTISRLILKKVGWIALAGTALGLIGGVFTYRLYQNLRTDFGELLPATARSVKDMNEVSSRLESLDNLAILVFSNHPVQSKRFVTDLATRLQGLPHSLAARVEYRISQEIEFFERRKALYMDLRDLKKIRNYVHKRIQYEKAISNPVNILGFDDIPEPKLPVESLYNKYDRKLSISTFRHFPDDYFATPDQKIRVILVYLQGLSSNIHRDRQLSTAVERAVRILNPRSYAEDIQIRYSGGVQDALEEHSALVGDVKFSTLLVILLVVGGLLLYYRSIAATTALVLSLLMGVFWTFWISFYWVGYLNANSAFLGSIVLGNGINFGIIFLARYLEERRSGIDHLPGTAIAIEHTAGATWTAALAAALAYGSLMLTDFRGFKQFGAIGLIGMVLCWISSIILMPAYLTLLSRMGFLKAGALGNPKHRFSRAVAKMIGTIPKTVLVFTTLFTIVAAIELVRFNSSIVETNLGKLRNRMSLEHGSAFYSRYLDRIFRRYLSPVVILARAHPDALKIERRLRGNQLIASVETVEDFIPGDQKRKIKILREIRRMLPPGRVRKLPRRDRARVKSFLNPAAFHPITLASLPPMIREQFSEKKSGAGKIILVEPPLRTVTDQGPRLVEFIHGIRQTVDSVRPGTPVAGTLAITADMTRAIWMDGPKATGWALAAVVLLVIVLFRRARDTATVLASLLLGILWLSGIVLGFWWKINFLNFIALPITFGIGVDYAVNIYQRLRQEGDERVLEVVRTTGSAVILASYTTVAGYTSLLLASNQAFVSFGRLAVTGEICCVGAAVISLPAYIYWRNQRRRRKKPAQKLAA